MKQINQTQSGSAVKKSVYLLMMAFTASLFILSFKADQPVAANPMAMVKDSAGSVKAFMSVYQVLMSPRCMNCHPSGDIPLQGEDSHLHSMGVKRGPDGKGMYALKCANCHQAQNTPGLHTPPGNPKWHLPPANMRMVFQGRTPRQLAIQILDPKQNGGKTIPQLIAHVSSDDLVLGGWNPGEGRRLPPMTHAAFASQFKIWIAKGAYAPGK